VGVVPACILRSAIIAAPPPSGSFPSLPAEHLATVTFSAVTSSATQAHLAVTVSMGGTPVHGLILLVSYGTAGAAASSN